MGVDRSICVGVPDGHMSTTHDELAGIVDLFGALTRGELAAACSELAFKQGQDVDKPELDAKIEAALDAYVLAEYNPVDASEVTERSVDGREPLVTVGPTAFPTLPPNAEDLPHILEFERRSVDRERLATQVCERLCVEGAAAVDAGETDRAAELVDVAYDIELWAPLETEDIRAQLIAALPQD